MSACLRQLFSLKHRRLLVQHLLPLQTARAKGSFAQSQTWRAIVARTTRGLILFNSLIFASIESVHLLRKFLVNPKKFFVANQRLSPPKLSLDPRFGQHKVAKLKDVQLHYVANGKPGAPLILMIHGWPECWWCWRHQLARFGDKNYAVAFDLRGFCDSSKPLGIDSYRIRHIVEDVKGMIEHLGYQKCVVIAHDWGGTAAWNFAMRYPSMVEKLIVLNCPHPLVFSNYIFNVRHWPNWWYLFYFQLPKLPELSWRYNDYERFERLFRSRNHGISDPNLFTDTDMEMYKYAFSQPGALTASINYYRSQFSYNSLRSLVSSKPTADLLRSSKVKPQTLVLWGERDAVLPPAMAAASTKYCENAEVRLFKNATHWLQQHEPEAVNDAIAEFIARK